MRWPRAASVPGRKMVCPVIGRRARLGGMTWPPAEGSRIDWADVPEQMRAEIERGMKLMGCTAIDRLSRDNLRFR